MKVDWMESKPVVVMKAVKLVDEPVALKVYDLAGQKAA